MIKWLKYILIFAVIGFVLGYIIGLMLYQTPICNDSGEACMGQPDIYARPGGYIGLIVGAVIGLIIERIKKK